VGGVGEPFFEPGNPAQIHFREDFVRSALHEIAHWCVAGKRRRQFPDYGYWYAPDGRTAPQQAAFFTVEARPQAVESIFCDACGIGFSPSVDNVNGGVKDAELRAFVVRIANWRSRFLKHGLPARAERFLQSLNEVFAHGDTEEKAQSS
jgi:elongation factor P hydroxylase